MSRVHALLAWLERASDWLSPIVVKEVRQVVRGREFISSFAGSLLTGMAIAFFGATAALSSDGTSGGWTFVALMTCLSIVGLAVVPLGAFSALRNERMEQTLELITLTALSPRRIVIGKLLAQGVKLATLFAAVAPFIAMSFLLGGIDFVTILVSLAIVFLWSMWSCSVCLFLSTLLKSRAMSGLVFGGGAIMLILIFALGRTIFFVASRGGFGMAFGMGTSRAQFWWGVAIVSSACLMTMMNFVLLAENRLSLPTENRVTTLRLGFLAQFLLIVAWTLSFVNVPTATRDAFYALGVFGGLHLAIVAMFTVTEDLVVPRRVLLQMRHRRAFALLFPGGGRGAAYVLVQMVILILTAWLFRPIWEEMRWLLAVCAYICFFTGVPTLAVRAARPDASASLILRVGILVLLTATMLLPDLLYYGLWRPDALSLQYSMRHLINPLRTLANWPVVEANGWWWMPTLLGLTGLLAYGVLIQLGRSMTAQPTLERPAPAAAGEPGRVHAVD